MKPECNLFLMEKRLNSLGLELVNDSDSSCSLPFPPGFEPVPPLVGPDQDVNKLGLRSNFPICERSGGVIVESAEPLNVEVTVSSTGIHSESERSDETLYLINKERCPDLLCVLEVNEENDDDISIDGGISDGLNLTNNANKYDADCAGHEGVPASLPAVPNFDEPGVDGVLGEQSFSVNLKSGRGDRLYCINDKFVDVSRREDSGDSKTFDQSSGGDSIEEDSFAEACAAKEVWCRSGLFFNSSDEEEVRSKLCRQKKLEGKKGIDLRPKEQHHVKKTPCIQGRTLATRKLMSGTKPKLR
ncbi:hypothetical protein PIB30_012637 [Stylosanthes scabra]|uniref:Uncharacterized protein n=1 Tax=Stylosanthes scabra TaxID=79078 RepID=A0ABU6Y5Q5_9FABA|nr:hypothetical protein [Stylosanthes scabra]